MSVPAQSRLCPATVVALVAAAALPVAVGAQVAPAPPTTAAAARTTAGAIGGLARGADSAGAPVPFALVRLLPAEADTTHVAGRQALAQAVTTAGGRFHFAAVPAGRFRLQLVRIGYRPVFSSALTVAAGQTLAHELRIAPQPVVLAAVTVRGAPACLTEGRIGEAPDLATVWQQARDGVELRRAFERQYRFVRVRRQEGTIRRRFGGAGPLRRADTTVSTPDSAEVRDRRAALERRTHGYRRGNLVALPNEKDLTDAEFLRDHCLEVDLARSEGLVGVRFRPVTPQRDGDDVRGTLWLDAASYLARYLDVEWVRGAERTAAARVDYADVPAAGAAVRLPSGGRATVERVFGPARATVTGAEVTLTFDYRDVAPAATP